MALQAIILDFDGVIANSEPLHFEAFQSTLAEDDITLTREQYYERYLGFDDYGLFMALARDRSLKLDHDWATSRTDRKGHVFEHLLESGSIVYPGVVEFIRHAAAQVPLAIASGAQTHEIRDIVERAGIGSLFATIVGAGDTPRSKPSPDPYVHAFRELQRLVQANLEQSRTVAVEDSQWGLESARGAGLRCVAVTTSYRASELVGAELIVDRLDSLSLDALGTLCATPAPGLV